MRTPLRVPRCSLLDIACIAAPVWVALIVTHTIADADLWGHLRFGTDLLATRALTAIDPYSFTSDMAWINHEWLSEVLVAIAYALGGAAGLNMLKLLVIAAIGAIVWRSGRRAGGSPRVLVVLTTIVLFASYTRTQVLRPQLFSVLLFTMLVALLQRDPIDKRVRLGVPAIFCVWANAHGGWIVGFVVLGLWMAFHVLNRRTLRSFADAALLVLSGLAATLINPYGTGLWTFLRQTVGLSRNITDWAPFTTFHPLLIAFELVLPAIAAVALWSRRRAPSARDAAVVAALAFATYRVGRVDAFAQIAIGLLFAEPIVEWLSGLEAGLQRHVLLSRRSIANGLAAAAIVIAVAAICAPRLGRINVEGRWTPDASAVPFLRQSSPNARLLTWFDWGEYAIWHLSAAGIRVSMDGRRETVYSDRVLADHWDFYDNRGDAWKYADAIDADRIWLPKRLPIATALRSRGWHVVFESDASVVLARQPQPQVARATIRVAEFP